MNFFGKVLSILSVGLITSHLGYCVIIMDSGNPARFIRGTFVDVNQPEFFGSSISEKQENSFPVLDSVHTLTENIVEHLDKFNEAMIRAMKKEVEKTDAASAVNTCRFARSRLTAMRIKSTFELQLVKIAAANVNNMDLSSSNSIQGVSETVMSKTAEEFNQMAEDLHEYEEATHGKEAMIHFQEAVKNFNSLQLVLSETNE